MAHFIDHIYLRNSEGHDILPDSNVFSPAHLG
jgi:hypothetical protein